jgi:GGDEF domain-containing protein
MTSRAVQERILLIGDADRQVHTALSQALPGAQVTVTANVFDGIAELAGRSFTAVLAAAEPVERRPEAALGVLRELAGEARIILFGQSTLEPLARKMLDFGCDDYFIAPATPGEIQQLLGTPLLRLTSLPEPPARDAPLAQAPPTVPLVQGLPLAEVFLDALKDRPGDAAQTVVGQINQLVSPTMHLAWARPGAAPPAPAEGQVAISSPVREGAAELGHLWLLLPRDEDSSAARHFLARLAQSLAKVTAIQEQHAQLQVAATTDYLTGVYNVRYFRIKLEQLIGRAMVMRFPVTLLLFDIDNLKQYNDAFGHAKGDEVLRQTAALMKRCCREHDVVGRIGGDEFAVVFWEKGGPRQPREPRPAGSPPPRPPNSVLQIIGRFQKLIASQTFNVLGSTGHGVLTVSGGLAQFPYDGRTADELIAAADRDMMFNAKQAGKNKIILVGSGEVLRADGGEAAGPRG